MVILVDKHDGQIGEAEKMEVHYSGQLHRAFSIFIFTSDGRLLLQQRAENKYHSGGKWTNTCCSHPRPGEATMEAAKRRLAEEMGLTSELVHMFCFTYHAQIEQGLTEHEFDHVYFGVTDKLPSPDPLEVASYRYLPMDELITEIGERPEIYTAWLKICFEKLLEAYSRVFKISIKN